MSEERREKKGEDMNEERRRRNKEMRAAAVGLWYSHYPAKSGAYTTTTTKECAGPVGYGLSACFKAEPSVLRLSGWSHKVLDTMALA